MDRFFVYLKNYKELLMKSVAVFKSSTSQAIRLPKDAALPESVKRVDIIPVGRGRLIVPVGEGWDSWFREEGVTDKFMASREQPADQEREAIWCWNTCRIPISRFTRWRKSRHWFVQPLKRMTVVWVTPASPPLPSLHSSVIASAAWWSITKPCSYGQAHLGR